MDAAKLGCTSNPDLPPIEFHCLAVSDFAALAKLNHAVDFHEPVSNDHLGVSAGSAQPCYFQEVAEGDIFF